MSKNHNLIAEDLAYYLNNTPFLDVPLGSVQLENAQRADVLTIKPSYNKFSVSIYEVKISRSDFLSDIRTEKWKGYLEHCNRFYFAVLEEMNIKKEEIPKDAGLIVKTINGWKVVKLAQNRNIDIPKNTLLSLIFMKQRQTIQEKHSTEVCDFLTKEKNYSDAKKIFGNKINNLLKMEKDYKDAISSCYFYKDILSSKIEEINNIYEYITGVREEYELNIIKNNIESSVSILDSIKEKINNGNYDIEQDISKLNHKVNFLNNKNKKIQQNNKKYSYNDLLNIIKEFDKDNDDFNNQLNDIKNRT